MNIIHETLEKSLESWNEMNIILETLEKSLESWEEIKQTAKKELIHTIKENRSEDKIFFWAKQLSTCLDKMEQINKLLKK